MKKFLVLILALVFIFSLAACGDKAPTDISKAPSGADVSQSQPDNNDAPSGIQDDGIGDDPSYGEGIGEVIALTPEEESYMLAQDTNSWLQLTEMEKDDLVVLIGRTLEATNGYIVPDYDELVAMLDHQMEQYFRNDVNESVLDTARDILGVK